MKAHAAWALAMLTGGVASRAASSLPTVSVSLAAEQSDYYLGEPVRLTLSVHNGSREPLSGFFHLMPPHEKTTLRIRRDGEAEFRTLAFGRRTKEQDHLLNQVRVVRVPVNIEPERDFKSEMCLIIEPGSNALLFDRAGRYELYVEVRARHGSEDVSLRSNSLVLQVAEPPAAQGEAFKDFMGGNVPRVLLSWPLPPGLEPNLIASTSAFLDKHPQGPYSDKARAALVRGLDQRIRRREASAQDKELHRRLKDGDPAVAPNGREDLLRRAREAVEQNQAGESVNKP